MGGSGNLLPVETAVERGLKSSFTGIAFNLVLAVFKCIARLSGPFLCADRRWNRIPVGRRQFRGRILRSETGHQTQDEDHPYGHGKADPIASVIVNLALVLAAILIGVESIKRIHEPHPLPKPFTLWVLLGVVAVKLLLSRYVSSVGKDIESTAVKSDAWHHLGDAITSGFRSLASPSRC